MEGSSLVRARYLFSGMAPAQKANTKSARGRGHQAAAPDRSEDNGRARGPSSWPSESFAFARGLVRRFALNVRGRSPRTPLVVLLDVCSLPCGHGRFAAAPASLRLQLSPASPGLSFRL